MTEGEIIKNSPDEYVTIDKIQKRRHAEYRAKQRAAQLFHSVNVLVGDKSPREVADQIMEMTVAALLEAEEFGERMAAKNIDYSLKREATALRDALKPFANIRNQKIADEDYHDDWPCHVSVSLGDLRLARTAFKGASHD